MVDAPTGDDSYAQDVRRINLLMALELFAEEAKDDVVKAMCASAEPARNRAEKKEVDSE